MMFFVLLAALALLMIVGFAIVGSLVGLVLMLALAAFVGYLADAVIPGRTPYGWPGLALVGVVGGWIGTALFGHVGPHLFGLWIVPAFFGALILTAVIGLVAGRRTAY